MLNLVNTCHHKKLLQFYGLYPLHCTLLWLILNLSLLIHLFHHPPPLPLPPLLCLCHSLAWKPGSPLPSRNEPAYNSDVSTTWPCLLIIPNWHYKIQPNKLPPQTVLILVFSFCLSHHPETFFFLNEWLIKIYLTQVLTLLKNFYSILAFPESLDLWITVTPPYLQVLHL